VICCKENLADSVRGCDRGRERGRDQREGAGCCYRAEIQRIHQWHLQVRRGNPSSLAAKFERGKEREEIGELGIYSGRFSKVGTRERAGEWGLWGVHPREVGGKVGDGSDG
jgi:hypothetical protein